MENKYEYRIKITYDEGDEFWLKVDHKYDKDFYRRTRLDSQCAKFANYDDALIHAKQYKTNQCNVEIIKTNKNEIINFSIGPRFNKISDSYLKRL